MPKKSVFVRFLISYVLILSIPLGIGSIAYMKAGQIVEQESTRYNMAMLQQVRQVVDAQLMDMKQFALEITYNPNIQAMLEGTGDDVKQRQLVVKTLSDLFRYKSMNQFIDDVYIYFKNDDTIISPAGQWHPSFFYDNMYHYDDISYDQWYGYLKRQDGFNGYLPLQSMQAGKWPENVITYIQPLMWRSKVYAGNLVILINERKIYDLLKNIELANHGLIYVVDGQNNMIASTKNNYDNLTAPLTVPDAPGFNNMFGREGTVTANYDNEDVVASYATSYVTDWKYVSIVPTSIFMDKVEYIRTFTLWTMAVCLVIGLVLAYFLASKNYNPIKELIAMLSSKSNTVGEPTYKNEYDFIKEAITSTVDESQRIKDTLSSQRPMLRTNLLFRLIHGHVDSQGKDNISRSLELFDIQLISDKFAVMVMDIDDRSGFIKADSEYEWALVRFVTTNVMEELGNRVGRAYMVELNKDQLALLINFDDSNTAGAANIMMNIAQEAKIFWEREFNFFLTIGIGDVHEGIPSIETSYREAVTALNYKIIKGSHTIIYYGDIQQREQNYYYPLNIELQLINYIKAGEFEKAEGILNDILHENFIERNLPYRLIQCLFFDIMSTAIKTLNEIKVDYADIFGPVFNPVEQILECQTVEQMHDTIKNIYECICCYITDNRKSHNVELCKRIITYIEDHYDDVNLGVATIAEYFKLNPSYLSYFFKEQTDQNMTDYINSVRLRKAKELLHDNNLTINEIAKMIGYGTAARFIRVFKKGEGITPGEYRNSVAF
ncbi:MAG: two-component system, response regulator YesN [Clostridiales bacterium]|jgi:AraC-like DNA-binding protein|nr:two-component system, response regulator YesN [Clostridiales bacterium]